MYFQIIEIFNCLVNSHIKTIIICFQDDSDSPFKLPSLQEDKELENRHQREVRMYIIPTKRLEEITNLGCSELKILIGSKIKIDYFNKDDILPSGKKVNFYGTIIKSIDVKFLANKEIMKKELYKNIEKSSKYKIVPELHYYSPEKIEQVYSENYSNKLKLKDKIQFGKYKGSTLEEILLLDFEYIYWSILHMDLLIDEKEFIYLDLLVDKRISKMLIFSCYESIDSHRVKQRNNYDASNDYSDFNFTRDVLDGDADAYWNID